MDLEQDSVNISIDVDPSKTNAIGQLCQRLLETQKDIEGTEKKLKELKSLEREFSEVLIPEAMQAAGMEDFKCSEEYGGARVKVSDFISAKIKVSDQEKALDWLRENGAGHLIKNTVSVDFDTSEDAEAQNFVADLQARNFNCKQKQGVHANTLSAYVREEFRNGRMVDTKLLGVYQAKQTKLILPEN
tara:strand:+ start:527 stop:1090 length:564 start_codon:yes stop_codon:yes gene_type:complete